MRKKNKIFYAILLALTTTISIVSIYFIVTKLLLNEETKAALEIYAKSINATHFYLFISSVILLIFIKWIGALLMFFRKAWAFVLYIVPNLILLSFLILIMVLFETYNSELIITSAITLFMIINYILALVFIIKDKKSPK